MEIRAFGSGSSGNSYYVSDGITNLLLDCGLPFNIIQDHMDYTVSKLDGVLITHEHGDHIKAAKQLSRRGITLYATQGTYDAIGLSGHRCTAITPLKTFTVGSFDIVPFSVEHDAADPVGYYLHTRADDETLLYITDAFYTRHRFENVNYLMLEVNYDEETIQQALSEQTQIYINRVYRSHMGLETALKLIDTIDVNQLKHVYILHMSNNHANEDKIKKEIVRATGAPVTIF